MTFESYCLVQEDAACLAAEALLVSIQRERFAKDARAQVARLFWIVEQTREPRYSDPEQYASHCKRGHPLSGDNLYMHPRGARLCRACRKLSAQKVAKRVADQRSASPRSLGR